MQKLEEQREVIIDKYLETIFILFVRSSCPCGRNKEGNWDSYAEILPEVKDLKTITLFLIENLLRIRSFISVALAI
jgi:hypothetical protein